MTVRKERHCNASWSTEREGNGLERLMEEGRLLLLFTTQRKQQPGIICNVMREKTEREIMCVFVIIITAN